MILLVALSFGYERRYELADRVAESVEGFLLDDQSVIDADAQGLAPENINGARAVISMREAGTLNAMVGVPDFTRVRFDMPQTVTARSGEIVLEVAGALDDRAEAVLRVSVNGVRRSAVLLNRGELHRKLVLPLNTRELAADVLTVSLAIDGQTPQGACSADWNGGLVLQVLPSSHLSLQLSEPVTDPADKLLLAGAPARVLWPQDNRADQVQVLTTAYGLTQTVKDVLFSASASNGPALNFEDIIALRDQMPAQVGRDISNPLDLAVTLGQRRAQSFDTETRWRMLFDADTLPGQTQAVDLALTYTSAELSDAPWLLSVFLNDRLVHAHRTAGGVGNFAQRVLLPQSILAKDNVLTVIFQDSTRNSGPCAGGAPTVAELGVAKLITKGGSTPAPLVGFEQLLATGATLNIPAALTAFDGQVALDTLNSLTELGLDLRFDPADDGIAPHIAVVSKAGLSDHLKARDHTVWLAFQSAQQEGRLVTMAVTPGAPPVLQDMPRAVLVISATQENGS